MRRIARKGVPTARGINRFKVQARDPGQCVNRVNADIGDSTSVFAFFKLPGWARVEQQGVLPAKGNGVYFSNVSLSY